MDTEQPENKSVISIVHDFDKSSEKKAKRRENTLISFAMKAIARDQEKNILISRLQRELAKAQGLLNLLEMENDVKEKLVKEKEEEIKSWKNEIEILKNATVKNVKPSTIGETPSKTYKFSEYVISTQKNIVALPTGSDIHDIVSSSKVESTEPKVDSSKSKAKIVKKKSIKRTKETHVTNSLYNLRNRFKSKANGNV